MKRIKQGEGFEKEPRLSKRFTLIEMLLIVMIIAIFSSIFYRLYSTNVTYVPLTKTQETRLMLDNAMKLYKLDNGNYPTTEQGISALVTKPTTKPIPQHWTQYLKKIPVDESGAPYLYVNKY